MVICLERGADLHMVQLMPLPLTVSCFSKIQIGLSFLVPAQPGSPGKMAVKRVCVCVCVGMSYWWCLELYDQICYCVGENILAYTWPSNDKCLAVKGTVF